MATLSGASPKISHTSSNSSNEQFTNESFLSFREPCNNLKNLIASEANEAFLPTAVKTSVLFSLKNNQCILKWNN